MQRQIVIDTETTGLYPEKGHRIIEIGCVELINRRLSGNNFHKYINPECKIEIDSMNIHGITNEFLLDKPKFREIVNDFLTYIKGSELIAHNAKFDVNFINNELFLIRHNSHIEKYATIFDTLAFARKKFPGQRNTLDAICKRYQISLNERTFHGALLDAQLLAKAYLKMTGGQSSIFQDNNDYNIFQSSINDITNNIKNKFGNSFDPIIISTNEIEKEEHNKMLMKIKKLSGICLWKDITKVC